MKGINVIALSIMIILFITLASATDIRAKNVGTTIAQPCVINDSAYCSSAASCNLTLTSPTGALLINNTQMINQINIHTLFLSSPNVSLEGTYNYGIICNDVGYNKFTSYTFEVTNTGTDFTVQKSILYTLFTLIIGGLLTFCLVWSFKIPWEHTRAPDGRLINLNNKRMIKTGFIFFSYIFTVILFYVLWNLSNAFLEFTFLGKAFQILFTVGMYSIIPISLISLFMMVYIVVVNNKMEKLQKRGFNL